MSEPNATTTTTGSDVENILVSVSKHDLNKLEAAYARAIDRIEKLESTLWDSQLSKLEAADQRDAALARVNAALEFMRTKEATKWPWCQYCGHLLIDSKHSDECVFVKLEKILHAGGGE